MSQAWEILFPVFEANVLLRLFDKISGLQKLFFKIVLFTITILFGNLVIQIIHNQ